MTEIRPDYDAAVRFLRWWAPDGPWVLTAIPSAATRTFRPGDEDALREWLAIHGADKNLYYHVNPTRADVSKRPKRAEISSLVGLHVDVDPRAGEDLSAEQDRALALLRDPPGEIPPPSCIVFSGGGMQALWRLREPLPLDGSESAYEDAKLYNVALEAALGGDACRSIEHLMRLPGTINRPDARKRRRERIEALARVVEQHDDRVYELAQFPKAPPPTGDRSADGSPATTAMPRRTTDLQDLPDGVSRKARVVIAQGHDPDEPGKFPSRSEALFYVCCELARADCDDATILGIITDPEWAISASVLDKGRGALRYARRQVTRARDLAEKPELAAMNERYFVVQNLGGKCRVMEEVEDAALGRTRLTSLGFDDFRNAYMNRTVEVGANQQGQPILRPLGKWWLEHPRRHQYHRIEFLPEVDAPEDVYNLWTGFSVTASPGDCGLYLDHLRENVCAGDARLYEYVLSWMARGVQQPGEQGHVALVLRGGRGVGKGTFATEYGRLFGRHFYPVSNANHLVGNFNAHLQDAAVVFADEAFYAGDKKHEAVLKTLITEDTLAIEGKHRDVYLARNCVSLIMASNADWVVPAGPMERRFLVLDVAPTRAQDHAYFGAICEQMDAGGRAALLNLLRDRDLSGFEVRRVPNTAGLADQKLRSLPPTEEWVLLLLEEGVLPLTPDERPNVSYSNEIGSLPGLYTEARTRVPALRIASDKRLGMALAAWGVQRWSDGGRRGWEFPPLRDLRATWEERYGPRDWEPPGEWMAAGALADAQEPVGACREDG